MDLKDLYRDVILDHNKRPRNFGRIEPSDAHADGQTPETILQAVLKGVTAKSSVA